MVVYHVIYYCTGKNKDELGPLGTIVSGGVAGVTLWTVIFPADVIKSRQQVSDGSKLNVQDFLISKFNFQFAIYMKGINPFLIHSDRSLECPPR